MNHGISAEPRSSETESIMHQLSEIRKDLSGLQSRLYHKVSTLMGDFPVGVEPKNVGLSDGAVPSKTPPLTALRMELSELRSTVSLLSQTISATEQL